MSRSGARTSPDMDWVIVKLCIIAKCHYDTDVKVLLTNDNTTYIVWVIVKLALIVRCLHQNVAVFHDAFHNAVVTLGNQTESKQETMCENTGIVVKEIVVKEIVVIKY